MPDTSITSLVNSSRSQFHRALGWWRWHRGQPLSRLAGRWCRRQVERLPPPVWPEKPLRPLTIVMLCGRAQISLLQVCLRSIALSWSHLPTLKIVTDGGCAPEEIADAIGWWRAPLRVIPFEEQCRPARLAGTRVGRWVASQAMVKKLALELSLDEFPVLYADTDVLWFRELPDERDDSTARITVATDQFPSYAPELIAGAATELASPPHLNAGVVLLRAALGSLVDVESLLAPYHTAEPHWLAEQTIVALAARRHGNAWSSGEIAMDVWDAHRLRPSYRGQPWFARHYTSPVRDLFWRDAWWLLARHVAP